MYTEIAISFSLTFNTPGMKPIIICIAILNCFFWIVSNEVVVSGVIVEQDTNEPILQAVVQVSDANGLVKQTLTDFDGNFSLKLIRSKIYNLKISYVGYTTRELNKLKFSKDTFIKIALSSGVTLTQIEVVSYRAPLIEKDNTTQGHIISSELIKKMPAKNTLGVAPSVAGLSSGDGRDVIKGSRTDATVYYLDGVRITGRAIEKEMSKPALPTIEEKSETTKKEIYKSESPKNEIVRSGLLTAGEINDLAKWTLWEDPSHKVLTNYKSSWKLFPRHRFSVMVMNKDNIAVVDAPVLLVNTNGEILWKSRTDNLGRAELWIDEYQQSNHDVKNLKISTTIDGNEFKLENIKEFGKGINIIEVNKECIRLDNVDIGFVIDATSSMADELEYLKSELDYILNSVKKSNPEVSINTGCIFYRDLGDDYVTDISDMTGNLSKTAQFINQHVAGGGGDMPEALDVPLKNQ